MSVLEWVANLENIKLVLEVLGGLVAIASVITGATKTPKDDAVVSKIRAVLDRVSVLTHSDAVGTLKAPLTKSKTSK